MSIATTGSSYLTAFANVAGGNGVRTVCGWFKIPTAVSAYQTAIRFSDEGALVGGIGGGAAVYETDSDTAEDEYIFLGEDPSTSQTTDVNAVNVWIFVAFVFQTTAGVGTLHAYWRLEGATSLSHTSISLAGSTPTDLYALCDRGSGIVQSGGKATALKAWTGQHSAAQLLAESAQKAPFVTSGVWSYLSCAVGSTIGTDESGAGHNWTVTGSGLSLSSVEPIMALHNPGKSHTSQLLEGFLPHLRM